MLCSKTFTELDIPQVGMDSGIPDLTFHPGLGSQNTRHCMHLVIAEESFCGCLAWTSG